MDRDKIITRIRKLMKQENIQALIITDNDPHQSEYTADHWQARQWITGFNGSAGTAVITHEQAILWTDFRYYIQAENQIQGSWFQLYKLGKEKVPDVETYLADTLKPGDTIGIDGNFLSTAAARKFNTRFNEKSITLNTSIDFISPLWKGRPLMPDSKAFFFPESFAGRSRADKLSDIRKQMKKLNASLHLMAHLDDIAWTFNLRGSDIHTNPVNMAYALIFMEKVRLCIQEKKLDQQLKTALAKDGIETIDYHEIFKILAQIQSDETILLDPENVNYKLFSSIPKACKVIEKPNPAAALKTVKNDIEISHLKKTAVKDGCAVVNFLFWLENQPSNAALTEITTAEKLLSFRKQLEHFKDNSFDSIMAFGENSAMCHYHATPENNVPIEDTGMFLTDSGGHYLTGTTDITRTICRGTPTPKQINDYTLVLKGHIAVASARFPTRTRGYQIDTLARQYLWENGMDFGHGTGHGVGFFLCVHEGPARLSPLPVDVKLKKGMVLTNEPGVYREGEYGIRLENMVLVKNAIENEFGTFMAFDNLTYCHFEKDLMDKTLLSEKEIQWIDQYHSSVYKTLSPFLTDDVHNWLRTKTGPL